MGRSRFASGADSVLSKLDPHGYEDILDSGDLAHV